MNRLYITGALCAAIGLMTLSSLRCVDLRSKYGVVTLRGPDNQALFFKREVRGLSYEVVVLSTSNDHCREVDSTADYVFSSDPLPMYYSLENNTLNLYLTVPAAPPPTFKSPIKIAQHQLSPLEFADLKKNFRDRGLQLLDIPIDDKLRCK
jgi:hypothetical protein